MFEPLGINRRIRGIRNDDSTVLKEKDGEGTKMMMEQEIFPEFEKILFIGTKKSLNLAEKNYKKIQTESPFGE